MSLRFIYGRAGSGKTTYCLNNIRETLISCENDSLIKKNLQVLLIPEQLTFQSEKRFLENVGPIGVTSGLVLSFKRMAYRVFKEVGGITRTHMDASGKSMLIYKILEDISEDMQVFSGASKQSGFVSTVSQIISEFKRYNITPEDLNLVKERVDHNGLLYNKICDISLVYGKFENTLHERYIDSDDDLTILCEKLDQSNLFNGAEIWIDEFSGFIPQQYKLIEKLLKKANRVNITLNMAYEDSKLKDNLGAFSPILYTEDKLVNIACENGISLEEPIILENKPSVKFKHNEELAYLEQNYFAFPFKTYKSEKSTEHIKLFRAINVYSEVEKVAGEILTLCREKRVRFNEIALITRELDIYENIIKAVFKEYDIPYFIDKKKDVRGNALIVLLLSVMDIFNKNWSYEALFRYLKTGLLDLDKDNVDILENYVLASGIRGKNSWTDNEKWYERLITQYNLHGKCNENINRILSSMPKEKYEEHLNIIKGTFQGQEKSKGEEILISYKDTMEGLSSGKLREIIDIFYEYSQDDNLKELLIIIKEIAIINHTRGKIIDPLLRFNENIRGRKNGREMCEALFTFLCEVGVENKVEEWIDKFNKEGNQELVNEYSRIWNLIMDILDQVVDVLGDEHISIDAFVNVLSLGFGEHKMGFIPPALDQVIVSSVERLKSHNVKYLFIVGVNDGIFPSASNEEGILTDNDRICLMEQGVELAKDTRAQAFEEQYLIYTTLTLPSEYIFVSYPIANSEGKALRPSTIVSRLKALYPSIREESNVIEGSKENLDLIISEVPTFNNLISIFHEVLEKKEIHPLWKSVYKWYAAKEYWGENLENILMAFSYTNQVEKVKGDKVLKLYGDKRYFSVSRIEKYIQCPFAYFVNYGLNAKERKVFNLTPPDLGTFLHKVIDMFSKTVDEKGLKWSELKKDWCEEVINEKVEEELSGAGGNVFRNSPKYGYFAHRLKRVLTRTASLIVEHIKRGGFEPLGYEIEFGLGKEGYPPIDIELSTGEKIKLVGKIDRVDKLIFEDKEYFRIIDYKSGNKDFDLSEVYYGLQLQLLTYLDAIINNEEGIKEYPIFPAGILYFKIDDPIVKGKGRLSEEEIEKEIMKALKMKGLLLADTQIIKNMDNDIEGASLIIPAGIKKDGTLSSRSRVATKEQFEELREHVRIKLIEACENMLMGDIKIQPCKSKKGNACDYCLYLGICEFDPLAKDNKYKILNQKKDEEVWKLIQQEIDEFKGEKPQLEQKNIVSENTDKEGVSSEKSLGGHEHGRG